MNDNTHINVLFAGWCTPTKVDEQQTKAAVEGVFEAIQKMFPNAHVTMFFGLTDNGSLHYAFKEAVERAWYTIGIACELTRKMALCPADESHFIGSDWGDESAAFLQQALASTDPCVFVNIAGGNQSQREMEIAERGGAIIFHVKLERQ
ncbi:hypothetical protein KAZ57_02005 [Patescibacteria group bacterium]|nr:hypothetical protein [Patescibacteria group bacterium]